MMMIRNLLLAACLTFMASSTASAAECITEAPMTVYEDSNISPQNMDFDKENNMFIAHAGWLNDALVNYYKFRIFAPSTYPDVIAGGSSSSDVPIGKVYLVTTTGGFDGVLGQPIVQLHHADGVLYSDFMEIHFVTAPEGYVEDDFKGVKDIDTSGATVTSSGILVNMPVVPAGASLQHPVTKGTNQAPIAPLAVWYNCVEVWTYVFEVTDAAAATFPLFADTRLTASVVAGRAGESDGFEISVTPSMGSADRVNAIPIWHINQYQRGVVEGTGGGPDPNGMRNVINLDRPDGGYSPLWQIFWGTALPVDYSANEASSNTAMTAANGFEFFTTPMFVNCPNVGPVDKTALNTEMADSFATTISTTEDKAWILGSHSSLIFQADMPITFFAEDGTEIGNTMTNIMGAYEYELDVTKIPASSTIVKVMFKETLIRTLNVDKVFTPPPSDETEGSSAVSMSFGVAIAALGFLVVMM